MAQSLNSWRWPNNNHSCKINKYHSCDDLIYKIRIKMAWDSMLLVSITVSAQPICLHPERDNLIVGKRVMIAGWGKLSHTVRSPELQYLELPLTPWESCMRIYGQTGALESPKSVGMITLIQYYISNCIHFIIFSHFPEGQWMCAGGEGKPLFQCRDF